MDKWKEGKKEGRWPGLQGTFLPGSWGGSEGTAAPSLLSSLPLLRVENALDLFMSEVFFSPF